MKEIETSRRLHIVQTACILISCYAHYLRWKMLKVSLEIKSLLGFACKDILHAYQFTNVSIWCFFFLMNKKESRRISNKTYSKFLRDDLMTLKECLYKKWKLVLFH